MEMKKKLIKVFKYIEKRLGFFSWINHYHTLLYGLDQKKDIIQFIYFWKKYERLIL